MRKVMPFRLRLSLPALLPAVAAVLAAALACGPLAALAGSTAAAPEKPAREIFVPFEDLHILLEGDARRVLLSRAQYADLLARATKEAAGRPPLEALLVSADYAITVGQERAVITATLGASVLEDGLHTLGLDMAGVGLSSAALDGRGAPIGLADDGRLMLFLEGRGSHSLVLEMVAPLQTTAARQILNFQVPVPTATRMRLVVPGDVEVKSGAAVISRTFDPQAGETRFELLPERSSVSLVMTLNSRLKRQQRVVLARSVLVDELTQAYERLHATVSMSILHRAVDEFQFVVPEGFEITDVRSPRLANWAIQAGADGGRVLDVRLREEATGTVVLTLSAVRETADLASWRMPHLEPLQTIGQVAVVGLLLEDRLKLAALAPEGLIPISSAVLVQAIPATVLQAEPGAPAVRPVVAYYAPQGAFGLSAKFEKPPTRLLVTTNVLVALQDSGAEASGGFAILPQEEKLFSIDFSAPAGWDVLSVTGQDGRGLEFERYPAGPVGGAPGGWRIHVRLPSGLAPGAQQRVFFNAACVPQGWFSPWQSQSIALPVFAMAGAARDVGAVAVDARDDLSVRPEALEGLWPLDENEKAKYGLTDALYGKGDDGQAGAIVAYRYESQPYKATLAVERREPRASAETYSFLHVTRDALVAHYELVYSVEQARARRLALVLPASTPAALSIRGLDGVQVEEYSSEPVEGGRRWTALLAQARSGTVKLAVDFQSALPTAAVTPGLERSKVTPGDERSESPGQPGAPTEFALPIVKADGVVYQSGYVAVEGSAELACNVLEHPREVDIGELVDAQYQPGQRLLGAYVFVGDPSPVRVKVERDPLYFLPPAILQRVELATLLSTSGLSQTAARFLLRTKAAFIEVRLPKGSTLWSATLDSNPAKPQQEEGSILISLPASPAGGGEDIALRDLTVVYETPVAGLGFSRSVDIPAPRLFFKDEAAAGGGEVPVADLQWHLYRPTDYLPVASSGSVVTDSIRPPVAAATRVGEILYAVSGGVDFDHGLIGLLTSATGSMFQMSRVKMISEGKVYDRATGEENAEVGGYFEAPAKDRAARRPGAAGPMPATAAPPAATPAMEPQAPHPPPTKKPAPSKPSLPTKKAPVWALEGARSLKIDLVPTGEVTTFRSLGADPRLGVTFVDRRRLSALVWALSLAVLLAGVAMTRDRPRRKIVYVAAVLLLSALLPAVPGLLGLALVLNGTFYAGCILIAYYPVAALVRWLWGKVRGAFGLRAGAAATAAVVFALAALAGPARAADKAGAPGDAPGARPERSEWVIQVVPPPSPVKVPADAIILPYDSKSATGIRDADRMLVPYDRFVELWNLAYPDKRIGEAAPPAPYALAGASFSGDLVGDEYLLIEGYVDLDVYTDQYAVIPLPLEGGVLARADLDGKPAKLSVASLDVSSTNRQQQKAAAAPSPQSFIVLYASGKGRHRLALAIRMSLARQGGWRVAGGRLPASPATSLALRVPEARTEVRLGGVPDRRSYETAAPNETIRTALAVGGQFSVQWRPKVSEGQIDQTLTVTSTARFDVQEDQLHLVWALDLVLRRGEREFFSVELPAGYLVEQVAGQNVRGWEVREADGRQKLEVGLLKRAKDREQFTIYLWRAGPIPAKQADQITVPVVDVTGAIRHTGRLTVWRSPLLDVRTVETTGATRTDLASETNRPGAALAADSSPLGIRPYQAFDFVAVPFDIRLEVSSIAPKVTASVQSILRLAERENGLETRILLQVEDRPLYRAQVLLPGDLEVDDVAAPGGYEWGLAKESGPPPAGGTNQQRLTVYFAAGLSGQVPLLLRGRIPAPANAEEVALPRLEVLGVDRQEGDIAVQTDPAYDVRAKDLVGAERVFLDQAASWLTGPQRKLAQLALHYKTPAYSGRLVLARRESKVTSYTVTNVRVTDSRVEETILLDFTILGAGIREVEFRLPAHMKDARVHVPLLRQKTVETAPGANECLVKITLQDEVMNQLRVVVTSDRLLVTGEEAAPIPVVLTGQVQRQYVAVESAGRDEVVVVKHDDLEPLSREQREWRTVAGLFRGGSTQAFIVSADAQSPRLTFETRKHETVKTVAARIGLARTVLQFDSSGAYRAQVLYKVDNSTEQFLAIRLPDEAVLWTARVAGELVKPTVPDKAKPRDVSIPLTKTMPGDLDYAVVLKYGGKLSDPGSLDRVTFPLIHTLNINVDLSQVELYVPRKGAWFWFDGSLGPPLSREGDFEAGTLAYFNKVLARQIETLQEGGRFAQVRAMSNLKSLKEDISGLQVALEDYRDNEQVAQELSKTTATLDVADVQAAKVEVSEKKSLELEGDNRVRIIDLAKGQDNTLARNATVNAGANWDDSTVNANTSGLQTRTFNDAWLEKNALGNPITAQSEEAAQQAGQTGEAEHEISQSRVQQFAEYQRQMNMPNQSAGQMGMNQTQAGAQGAQAQPSAPQFAFDQSVGQKGGKTGTAQPEEIRRRGQSDVVAKYQEKLKAQTEQQQRLGGTDELNARDYQMISPGAEASFGTDLRKAGAGNLAIEAATGRVTIAAGVTMAAGGLRSLDVDLLQPGEGGPPWQQRWVRYRFKAPGGEDAIVTGWATSDTMLAGLKRLAVVVVAVGLAVALRRLLAGRRLTDSMKGAISTGLIVAGALGILFGGLPVAAAVALVAGIAWKIARRVVRHRRALRGAAA